MQKKIFLFIVLFFVCVSSRAQMMMIDSMRLSATGLLYGVYADVESNTEKSIFFDMDISNQNHEVKVKMPCYRVDYFLSRLAKAQEIFDNWQQKAKEESITLLSKKIPVNMDGVSVLFLNNGEWQIVYRVYLQMFFYVNREGDCFLIIESSKISYKEDVAKSNSSMITFAPRYGGINIGFGNSNVTKERTCEGATIVFSSVEEINKFKQKLYRVAVWKKKNAEDGKLFK